MTTSKSPFNSSETHCSTLGIYIARRLDRSAVRATVLSARRSAEATTSALPFVRPPSGRSSCRPQPFRGVPECETVLCDCDKDQILVVSVVYRKVSEPHTVRGQEVFLPFHHGRNVVADNARLQDSREDVPPSPARRRQGCRPFGLARPFGRVPAPPVVSPPSHSTQGPMLSPYRHADALLLFVALWTLVDRRFIGLQFLGGAYFFLCFFLTRKKKRPHALAGRPRPRRCHRCHRGRHRVFLRGARRLRRQSPWPPPGVVFAVVWPILYVTTGLAWALSAADADKAFVALVLLLCAWLPVYSCFSRPAAAGVLGASAVGAIALSAWRFSKGERWAGGLVVPLCAWLAFATYLNVAEVATTKMIH